ncbi:MAG: protein kinase [Oscillatoriales cyanobacterium SM2_2_1]|nr:protein kinase [Oscillatoriales cyanobacterium SM2_2_1]
MLAIEMRRSPQQIHPDQSWLFGSEQDREITVGRLPQSAVLIEEPTVSGHHLTLRRQEAGWLLLHHGRNPTYVDGSAVHQVQVTSGMVAQLTYTGPFLTFRVLPSCRHEGNPPRGFFCHQCGQPLRVLKQIRSYQVLKVLGRGGMGTTYEVWQAGQVRVLKEMNAEMLRHAKAQELFEREARTLQRLCHPGVPRFYDFFVEQGTPYLLMEMIYGQDLESLVGRRGRIGFTEARSWMVQLCEILEYLHHLEPPVIHRDVKPANILVRHSDQRVVLLDFGAVKEVGTPAGTCIGSPSFCPPEQNMGKPVVASDLYAIAPTLCYLLTGLDPSVYLQDRGQGVRLYMDQIPGVPTSLGAVIAQISAPRPVDRPPSARAIAQMLLQVNS